MTTTAITALGNDVHMIDTAMSGYDGITAAYAILGDRPCLVETGTATSARTVVDALASLGVAAADLASIVVTHIHLDHAGGVGDLARAFPGARIVVQESGARHLADPSRLMASARRVFGDAMDEVFGELLPTPAERIEAIGVSGRVDLGGGRFLEGHHTPGHARHHLGLVDSASGDLYVGDAAGLYIPPEGADPVTGLAPADGGAGAGVGAAGGTGDGVGADGGAGAGLGAAGAAGDTTGAGAGSGDGAGVAGTLLPGTPPPDFDLDLAVDSLARMRELGSTRLLFSHYGPITRVDESLERAEEELRLWVGLVREARSAQMDLDHTLALVRDRTRARYAQLLTRPDVAAKFEALSSSVANVVGISRWLEQLDEAARSEG